MKKNSTSEKWILIAVHKKVREFHAKALLSYILTHKGYNVIMARTGRLRDNMSFLPKGIYFDVGIMSTRKNVFSKYKDKGFKIVAFCEEAMALRGATYTQKRLHDESLAQTEAFFAWSPLHGEIVRESIPEHQDKVHVTGHPRHDLLSSPLRKVYQDDVDSIKAKHGRFILLNTNSGNHVLDDEEQQRLWDKNIQRNFYQPEQKKQFRDFMQYRRDRHKALMSTLPIIAETCPDYKIILRPHFTETDEVLERYLPEGFKDIEIIHENSVIPWILASDVIVHSNCSTGIESFLLDKPSISYRGVMDDENDSFIVNAVSREAFNLQEFKESLLEAIDKQSAFDILETKKEAVSHNLFRPQGALSSEKVAELLENIEHPRNNTYSVVLGFLMLYLKGLWLFLKRFIKKCIGRKDDVSTTGDTETLDYQQLKRYFEEFDHVLQCGGVTTQEIMPEVFIIKRKHALYS